MSYQPVLLVAVCTAGISASGAFLYLAFQEVPVEFSLLAPGVEMHVRALPNTRSCNIPKYYDDLPGKNAPQSPKPIKEVLIAFN